MLETGDVVLIGDFSLPGFVIRFGTKSLYKHVGVAVIINSEPYVLELIASHDVHLTKLKDYLKRGRIARYRKVKSCYRRDLEAKFLSFYKHFKDTPYDEDVNNYLSPWLGLDLRLIHRGMICSEFVALFYDYCLGPSVAKVDNITYHRGDLPTLFGEDKPLLPHLYNPGMFAYGGRIFERRLYSLKGMKAEPVLIYEIIFLLIVLVIIFLLLYIFVLRKS